MTASTGEPLRLLVLVDYYCYMSAFCYNSIANKSIDVNRVITRTVVDTNASCYCDTDHYGLQYMYTSRTLVITTLTLSANTIVTANCMITMTENYYYC